MQGRDRFLGVRNAILKLACVLLRRERAVPATTYTSIGADVKFSRVDRFVLWMLQCRIPMVRRTAAFAVQKISTFRLHRLSSNIGDPRRDMRWLCGPVPYRIPEATSRFVAARTREE